MASNSRYTARFWGRDLEYDEDVNEDYVMDAEESEHDIRMEDVEHGGSGHDGEGSDEDNEGEDDGDPEEGPARVITLDELRGWTDTGVLGFLRRYGINTREQASSRGAGRNRNSSSYQRRSLEYLHIHSPI